MAIREKNLTEIDSATVQNLIDEAKLARSNSYSPYSNFAVGAAVLSKSGKIYRGCNIENASYGLTNCGERTAIFKAVSEGETEFIAIAIVADSEEPCAPCGACRQVIQEFNIPIIVMTNLKGDLKVISLEELLPHSFGKESLIKS